MSRFPIGEIVNLSNLMAFVVTCQSGSYTRAANQLSLSQPAVHHQVRKLEAQLGVALVQIRDRRVVPTEYGDLVLRHATALLQEASALHEQIELAKSVTADIRVAAYSILAVGAVGAALKRFRRSYPDLQVTVRTVSHGDDPAQDLATQGLDFLLDWEPYAPSEAIVEPLRGVPTAIACSPDHPLAQLERGRPVAAQRVAEFPFALTPRAGFSLRQTIEEWLRRVHIPTVMVRYEATTGAILAQAVLGSDELVTALPIDAIHTFGLVPIWPVPELSQSNPVLCYSTTRDLSNIDKAFIEFVHVAFDEYATLHRDWAASPCN